MSVKERVKKFVKYENISIIDFEKSINVANGYVNSISKSIGIDKINTILEKYPNLNIEWLLTGNGEMLKDSINNKDEQDKIITANHTLQSNTKGIPLIPSYAMAGVFTGDLQILEYECERFVIPTFKDADFLIPVKGSSMEPKYSSGDLVACKKMSIDTFFQWNKVYVLDTEQGPLIKRVNEGPNNDTLLICSENPKYQPFQLNRSLIHNIALVVGVIRLE